ncbi:MAG: hypothetical protein O2826_00925, partial [Chloroflexi bacterium]|nr:hypothetical protein [Chloroflexota bacterium]
MALIAIRKGWNLISFPWIPVETSVAGVFADSEVVDILAYDSGIWSVASRGIKGASPRKYAEFEGTITQVDARLGYWVNAAADSSLEFSLADELRPTSYEIEISAGWNLIAVLTGGGPAVPDIDRYLANIDWSVAYSYSGGSEGRWQRMLPGQQQWLQMGKG